MKRIRVLVVDDHQIVRQGLRSILSQAPDIEVIGEVASGEEALASIQQQPPDIALVDIRLEGMSGTELCRRIRELSPGTSVVILTSFLNEALVRECVQSGARGYLLKVSVKSRPPGKLRWRHERIFPRNVWGGWSHGP